MYHGGGQKLLQAARDGLEGRVRKYLEAGIDANYQDADGNTALHEASVHVRSYGVLLLLLRVTDVDINKRNRDEETALISATRHGNYSAVRILIRYDANINWEDRWRFNALDYAKHYGHKQIARVLIEAGTRSANYNGRTTVPLRPVVHHDTPETMFRQLIKDPKLTITEQQLANVLQASKITTPLQFCTAHYLIQVLTRARLPVMNWFRDFDLSQDYLLAHVYYVASTLRLTEEEQFLAALIIQQAEACGLIRPGFAVTAQKFIKVQHDFRQREDRFQQVTDQVLRTLYDLRSRIRAIEQVSHEQCKRMHELADYDMQGANDLNTMREGLNQLFWNLKKRHSLEGIIGIVRCTLLLIPVVGPFFEIACLSAKLFFGCVSEISRAYDLVKGRASRALGVDLSDSASMAVITTEQFLSRLSRKSRERFEYAVEQSEFRSLSNLRRQLESSCF